MNENELSGGRNGVGIGMCSDTNILSLRGQRDIRKEREPAVICKAQLLEASEVLVPEVFILIARKDEGSRGKHREKQPRLSGSYLDF